MKRLKSGILMREMGEKGSRYRPPMNIPPEICRLFILEETSLGEKIKYRRILGERTDIVNLYGRDYLVSQVLGQKILYEGGGEQILDESPLEVLVSRFLGGDIRIVEVGTGVEIKTEKVTDEKEQQLISEALREKGFIGPVRFD